LILAIPASAYFYLSYFESRNVIGIIDVSGAILSAQDAGPYTEMIEQAIHNDSVKAVVLRIDCPGGDAEQIEGIYLDLLELKAAKPVIASVVFAASGGYYINTDNANPNVIVIRSDKGANKALCPVITRLGPSESPKPQVVFDKVGEKRILAEVYLPGLDGFQVAGTASEHSHQKVTGEAK
jgi:hypothetical protein